MRSNMQTRLMRDRFIQALLAGEHSGASNVVNEGLQQGISPSRIYLDVLAPSQMQIGQMWHDGEINVAQEHLATQITLRQMDRLLRHIQPASKLGLRAVVSAVEGEHHSIGARMMSDFLYMDGWDVDFLGENTPTDDLVEFVRQRSVVLVALSVTLVENIPNAGKAVSSLHSLDARPKVMLGGAVLESARDQVEALGADAAILDPLEAIQEARRLIGLRMSRQTLENYLEVLGSRIQSNRRNLRWSQQELADRAGLDRTYISMVEHGKQNLTLGAIMRIADALEVSIDSLLSQENAAT